MQCWESLTQPGGKQLEIAKRAKSPEKWDQMLRNALPSKAPRSVTYNIKLHEYYLLF